MARLVVMYHKINIVNEIHNVEVLKKLLRDLYVDDSTTSFNSFNEGVEFYTIAKK